MLLIFFLIFKEEDKVITKNEEECAEVACVFSSGRYEDPFLQAFVATNDDC